MSDRPQVQTLLAGGLGQWLTDQSALREEAKRKARQRQTWAIVAAMAVAVVTLILSHWNIGLAAQLGFFTGAGGFGWAELAKRPVINRIKGGINGAIAQALGLSFSVEVTDPKNFELAETHALLPSYDDKYLEDQWTGTYAGLPFDLIEAKLTEERGSGKSRHTVTVFQGVLMSVGFTRRFQGVTLVERDGRHRGWFGGEKDSITVNGQELRRVSHVDPQFEDVFDVWSSDPVEGQYLVHPKYVERLVAIESAFGGENIRALFCGGLLLVVLEGENRFESGSLEAGDDQRLIEQTIAQFGSLTDLAQRLNEAPRPGVSPARSS